MHAIIKKAALAAALATASLSAHALETKISVYADVDPTLALLRDDGTPLPDVVNLTHDPLRGLIPDTQRVRIHSMMTPRISRRVSMVRLPSQMRPAPSPYR